MLQDNAHPVLTRCSAAASRQATSKQMASLHIKFPTGLIRGALWSLGVVASVSSEVSELPRCQFTIRLSPRAQELQAQEAVDRNPGAAASGQPPQNLDKMSMGRPAR